MNPIEKFKNWYAEELHLSSVRIPSACCLTSIGLDGYPNARFVSLKEIVNDQFVITGPLNSRKGLELLSNPKAALIFWWTETERQVRIQGDAIRIENNLADQYFAARNTDSKIVSQISQQGQEMEQLEDMMQEFENRKSASSPTSIKRPTEWSGFYIKPIRIEFMEFRSTRFHLRELFSKNGELWTKTILQP